jgi:hypothetical protein
MTGDHLAALLTFAEAKKGGDGWYNLGQRSLVLHAAYNGSVLSFSRIESLKRENEIIFAKSSKGEVHVFLLSDVFAGTVDSSKEKTRKAGFASD